MKFTNLVWMIADQNFYDICLEFFWSYGFGYRLKAEGQSFSGPNIRLQPKVKIAPTVQHWGIINNLLLFRPEWVPDLRKRLWIRMLSTVSNRCAGLLNPQAHTQGGKFSKKKKRTFMSPFISIRNTRVIQSYLCLLTEILSGRKQNLHWRFWSWICRLWQYG